MSWEDALARRLDAPVTVLARQPLTGGYVAQSVERVELDVGGRPRTVVLKRTGPVEVAAMRALAVVRGIRRGQALAIGPDWLVLPFVDGPSLTPADPLPDEVWELLARVHAHWWGKRPRGLPVVDAVWWRGLVDRTLGAVRGGADRGGEPEYRTAASGAGGLARRSGDRGGARGAAPHHDALRSAPRQRPGRRRRAGAHRLGQRPRRPGRGRRGRAGGRGGLLVGGLRPGVRAALRGVDRLRAIEEPWARLHVHVQYLGFAADHLGPGRVGEMIDAATAAHAEPAPAVLRHQPG